MVNEGKLNINAPLMSVRRSVCTPTSSTEVKTKILANSAQVLPCNKSEMIQNQVTKPVVVPKTRSLRDILNKVDHEKGIEDEKVTNLEEDDDDDEGDAFSDALETLSSTESLCVSGLDNLDANKCRTSSNDDKQAQDFMMNRFLPAAKAMTLQPHQHAPRKQSVLLEQPSTKLVSDEKKFYVNNMAITDIIPYTGQYEEEESESESEEESDHETDDHANISAKGCGLFPSSCIKNSLCLLNPMPEAKTDNHIPMWSSYEVEKPNKSSHFSSYRSGPTIKKAWDAIHKSKSSSGASESKRYNTYSAEPNQISRVASFRRSGAASVSSFQSNSHSTAENNQSKKHESFQELQSQGSQRSSNSRNLSIEKTLYSDTCSTKSSFDKDTNINSNQIVVVDGSEKTDHKCVMHLLSPPLPKSPSESWLCRVLPLVSFKNSLAYSSRGTQQSHAAKMIGYSRASSYSKWETIVKTSNLHHDHECCSQELTIYKSQHSKS
ncbi:unnamed protein product [Vicia faba]|uniref:Uncharacterized protein n=1 Tax=Vicia faba TaxID=3906 RepID=A0AAV1B7R6_VICFA|nr:unnamed protein product [Vicia faba]